MTDLRQLKDKASEAFVKGKFVRAAELYAEYCTHEKRDHQARLRMGDAWAKSGKPARAIEAYKAAAEGFAKEGFLPRAIAASKLIIELDPAHQGVQQMLADLYAQKGGPPPSKKPAAAHRPAADEANSGSPQTSRGPSAPVATRPPASVAGESTPPKPEEAAPGPQPVHSEAAAPAVDVTLELPPELAAGSVLVPAAAATSDAVTAQPQVGASGDSGLVPSSSSAVQPPGLRRKGTAERLSPPAAESFVRNEQVPPAPPNADSGKTDVERTKAALSRFDELELNLEELTAQPKAQVAGMGSPASPPPAFTELEIEGSSLLHALERAATASQDPRDSSGSPEELIPETEDETRASSGSELPRIPLFSDLPPAAFIELFERCPLRRFAAGETVFQKGSSGDSFFVICEGGVRVVRETGLERIVLANLHEGAFFGEMALLSGAPRTAAVESTSDETQLLELSASVLAQLSRAYPQVAVALRKFCRQRLLANVLSTSPLFTPFGREDRRELIQRFRAREVRTGEVLIREGQRADGLYVVLSGEVEVRRSDRSVALLHEGELFGEMSLLQKLPANATVMATRRTSLLRLPRDDFDQLISSHPQVLMLVAELTEARQRQNSALPEGLPPDVTMMV